MVEDMITFPVWVTGTRTNRPTEEELATRRLRFLVIRASNLTNEGGSVASLAELCDVPRTEVHTALRTGHFSAKMALKIEKTCGRKVIRREWLVYPLDIEQLNAPL